MTTRTQQWWADMERQHREELEAWSKDMHWPPPTKDMTADQVVAQIQLATDYLEHLNGIITERCASEGHRWDNTTGKQTTICLEKGLWIPNDDDSEAPWGRSRGHWAIEPQHADVFQRNCTRCGAVENKKPVQLGVKSPWEGSQDAQ